jgi:hypothetical protein
MKKTYCDICRREIESDADLSDVRGERNQLHWGCWFSSLTEFGSVDICNACAFSVSDAIAKVVERRMQDVPQPPAPEKKEDHRFALRVVNNEREVLRHNNIQLDDLLLGSTINLTLDNREYRHVDFLTVQLLHWKKGSADGDIWTRV